MRDHQASSNRCNVAATLIKWPKQYLQIENRRLARELALPSPPLGRQSLPDQDHALKWNRELRKQKAANQAVRLMAAVRMDLQRCLDELLTRGSDANDGALKAAQRCVNNLNRGHDLNKVWKFCRKLAEFASEAHSTRTLYGKVSSACVKATKRGARFGPKPTKRKGGRPQILLDQNGVTTFLGQSHWLAAYHLLLERDKPTAAEQLLLEYWKRYGPRKRDGESDLVFRSHPAYLLAQHYCDRGERAAAARWAMLTFIQDEVAGHFGGEDIVRASSGVTEFLTSRFHVPERKLNHLRQQIRELRKCARANHWMDCWIHPEYVLALLMSERCKNEPRHFFPPELRHQSGTHSQFPLSDLLLKTLGRHTQSDKDKGRWLERLMVYLFNSIPGAKVRTNLLPIQRTGELDLLVECLPTSAHWLHLRLGQRVIVECKNTTNPTASREFHLLVGKMRYYQCDAGIIVSTADFTGRDFDPARALIALAAQSGPSNRILLIGRKDLETATLVEQGAPDFLAFLLGLCDEQWDRRDY